MTLTDRQTLGRFAGILAILTAVTAILLAGIVHDTFSIVTHSLSDLGSPGRSSALFFNNGLIIAGLLGSIFAITHLQTGETGLEKAGSISYLITSLNLSLIGLYPVGTDLHTAFSVSFFLLVSYTLFIHGTGKVLAGEARHGLISIWLGIIHATGWIIWAVALDSYLGIAAPEAVGTLIISGWTLWQVSEIRPQR